VTLALTLESDEGSALSLSPDDGATGAPDVVAEPPSGSASSLWLPIAQPGGSFKLMSADSGLCLSVEGAGPGRQLDQLPCSSRAGAAWQTSTSGDRSFALEAPLGRGRDLSRNQLTGTGPRRRLWSRPEVV